MNEFKELENETRGAGNSFKNIKTLIVVGSNIDNNSSVIRILYSSNGLFSILKCQWTCSVESNFEIK